MEPSTRARHADLDLRAMEMFVAVCETGTMTGAGQRIGASQPAVSQGIRALERSLGAELLDRQTRPLLPTAAGEMLLGRARNMLDEARATCEAVRRAAQQALPTLRLGLVDSFAVTIGPQLIKALQGDAEELRVWSGLSAQLWSGLVSRELDLLVTAQSMEETARVQVIRLYREPFLLAMPPGPVPAINATLAHLCEQLPLIRYSLRSITGVQVERYLRRMRMDAPRRMEFDGSESVMAMVSEGLGWTLTTPLCLLQGRANLSRMRLAPLPSPAPRRGLFLMARDDYDTGRMEALAHRIRRLLASHLKHALARPAAFALTDIDFL